MSKKSFRLRPARKKDLETIFFIERQSFPTPWSVTSFYYEHQKPYATLWVVENCYGKIVGYICFWMIEDEVHLVNIAVSPESRRQGVASFMLKTMIRYARHKKAKRIFLEVRETNRAAIALYQKLGFKIDGRRKGYYSDTKEDAILMSFTIG